MLNETHPNEVRFLIEEVYPEIKSLNTEVYIIRTGFLKQDTEINWEFDGKAGRINEYTPIEEINTWPLPSGGNYQLYESENELKEYYEKLVNQQLVK